MNDSNASTIIKSTGNKIIEWMVSFLPESLHGEWTQTIAGILIIGLVAGLLQFLVRVWIIRLLHQLRKKAEHPWYDALLQCKVPQRALFLLPLLIFHLGIDWLSQLPDEFLHFLLRFVNSLMILVVARTLGGLLTVFHTIYMGREGAGKRPIKGYIQLLIIFIYIIAVILIFAQLVDQSPWYFLSGIGAISAILLLIFRDTLLSLVAGVQLTNNNLIEVGDWIEMSQFGADGDVIDIALHSVRVQNWDKTIAVIPTHKFLDNSFRNWRGMKQSGGRRIKRSLYLDIESIRFLTLKEVRRLRQSHLLKEYFDKKLKEVDQYNAQNLDDASVVTNARWLTNIGTFRAYVSAYMKNHPQIHKKLLVLIRQHEPTENGLPMEVYAFVNSTEWLVYEQVQSDIFDHLLSILPEFGLRHFQKPSGYDFDKISENRRLH